MIGEKIIIRNCKFCNAPVGVPVSHADVKIGHMCKECRKERLNRYFERR